MERYCGEKNRTKVLLPSVADPPQFWKQRRPENLVWHFVQMHGLHRAMLLAGRLQSGELVRREQEKGDKDERHTHHTGCSRVENETLPPARTVTNKKATLTRPIEH